MANFGDYPGELTALVPVDILFIVHFPLYKSSSFPKSCSIISRIVSLGNATSELEQLRWWQRKGENKKATGLISKTKILDIHVQHTTLFSRFICHHHTTNVVKLDQNGNAIIILISKINSLNFLLSTQRESHDFLLILTKWIRITW